MVIMEMELFFDFSLIRHIEVIVTFFPFSRLISKRVISSKRLITCLSSTLLKFLVDIREVLGDITEILPFEHTDYTESLRLDEIRAPSRVQYGSFSEEAPLMQRFVNC